MAFYSLAFKPGDRILTARAEYAANYVAVLQVAKAHPGAVIEVIPDDADGVLDPQALRRMIDDRVKLIAITWVPTNGGLGQSRRRGRPHRPRPQRCRYRSMPVRRGQMQVDIGALQCDMLSATGRKFSGAARAAPASLCTARSAPAS